MSPESSTESYPAFARIGLRENPGKNLNQVACPDRDSNPDAARRADRYSTGVDQMDVKECGQEKRTFFSMYLQFAYQFPRCISNVHRSTFRTVDHRTDNSRDTARALVAEFGTRAAWSATAIATSSTIVIGMGCLRLPTHRNMLGENPQTVRENTEILLEASKAIGLEVNPEKTKYMIMPRDQNIVRNGNIKIGDLSFEQVEKFKYLGATVTNINDIREEIKRRINMGNECYYSVEKLLSSSLLSKNLKVTICKTVILPVLLYGCETWTLTLREEHRLRVFENKVLRKIFGAKRDEVTGEWRKLHNTELHALYSSPDIIRNIKSRRLRWAGHVARMGESTNAYRVLVGRPEGKRPLGRPRRRWKDNIKMDLREVGYDDRDWINLAQDRDRWRAYSGSSTESYPAFARIGLRENPGKNLNQVTCPDRDSNPGHLVSRLDALTVTPQVWSCWLSMGEISPV
ncbi:hypothetical protein ANN_07920 [Periplaneta americana]|uniref:Endonuclease-reverse transcriptase n=1 Tax=Periplaneta americana TaxID=6978 RepID=A0ABQ8T1H4_PERAM|nr:hypothetical protein ANN_07920 [Periplaneta americana]